MSRKGLLPWIVGSDLRDLDRPGWKQLALIVPEEDDMTRYTREIFFKSLRPHEYLPKAEVVILRKQKIKLHISALRGDEVVVIKHLRRLFQPQQASLRCNLVACRGREEMIEIGSDRIGGLCKGRPTRKSQVKTVCSLRLHYANGEPIWQNLVASAKTPSIRGVLAFAERDDGSSFGIGHHSFRALRWSCWQKLTNMPIREWFTSWDDNGETSVPADHSSTPDKPSTANMTRQAGKFYEHI